MVQLPVGAEGEQDRLLNEHPDSPGGQQGVQGPVVEEADQADLEQVAHQGDGEEGNRDGPEQVQAEVLGIADVEGGVGPQH